PECFHLGKVGIGNGLVQGVRGHTQTRCAQGFHRAQGLRAGGDDRLGVVDRSVYRVRGVSVGNFVVAEPLPVFAGKFVAQATSRVGDRTFRGGWVHVLVGLRGRGLLRIGFGGGQFRGGAAVVQEPT